MDSCTTSAYRFASGLVVGAAEWRDSRTYGSVLEASALELPA